MNWRNLAICLTALPLSLLVVLLLNWLGQGLNTMTLGLAVAIGSAVDDAIVDAENVYRCLRKINTPLTRVPFWMLYLKAAKRCAIRYLDHHHYDCCLLPSFRLNWRGR